MLCCAMLCCAVPCCAILCCAVLCHAVLSYAASCCAVPCCARSCYTMLCHACYGTLYDTQPTMTITAEASLKHAQRTEPQQDAPLGPCSFASMHSAVPIMTAAIGTLQPWSMLLAGLCRSAADSPQQQCRHHHCHTCCGLGPGQLQGLL